MPTGSEFLGYKISKCRGKTIKIHTYADGVCSGRSTGSQSIAIDPYDPAKCDAVKSNEKCLKIGAEGNATSAIPSAAPSVLSGSAVPTAVLSVKPTLAPSVKPTYIPSVYPTSIPSTVPSTVPSVNPSTKPSSKPSGEPSSEPSLNPSGEPSSEPSIKPSGKPSSEPSMKPSTHPSSHPSSDPSVRPTSKPTYAPTESPTTFPTAIPTSSPTFAPTAIPSVVPTTAVPTAKPTVAPSMPTAHPTAVPTAAPTFVPTPNPTATPTRTPSAVPSTQVPTATPTVLSTIVTTIAGVPGTCGSTLGNGTAARINPTSFDLDANNNMYIADSTYIRKVNLGLASYPVTSYVGSSSRVYVNGPCSVAKFNSVNLLTIDRTRNLMYVWDDYAFLIRMVNLTSCNVSTIAGAYYVSGYVDGVGLAARFNQLVDIRVNSVTNMLYMLDKAYCVIRQMNLTNYNVSTIAGLYGTCGYVNGIGRTVRISSQVRSGGLDITKNYLYFTDNSYLRRMDLSNFNVTTVLSGLNTPSGFVVDPVLQTIYGTSINSYALYLWNPLSHTSSYFVGGNGQGSTDGPGTTAKFWYLGFMGMGSNRSAIYAVDGCAIRAVSLA